MVTRPPAFATASLASFMLATCSTVGFCSGLMSPFSIEFSIDHCVRFSSRPSFTDHTQFLVSTPTAYSTASLGFLVASTIAAIVDATKKPKEAVEYAVGVLTKNCVWSVNEGLDPERTQWSINNSIENGDIKPEQKPTVEQVANMALAREAVEKVGGRVTFGNCKV